MEYDLLMQIVGPEGIPSADLIEAISYSSKNPLFRTVEFRRWLIDYRNEGCHARSPKVAPTPRQIKRAIKKRQQAAEKL